MAPPAHDIIVKDIAPTTYDSPSYYIKQPPRWHKETLSEPAEPKILRRLREYNYLMTWMDNEFWEQNEEMYQEKIQSLQKELKTIQEGDHAVFQELVTDLEIIRDQTIESALCFENYQMTMTKQDFDLDVMLIEEEYKSDSQHLDEVLLLVIDEHRKQIRDDREDTDRLDIDGIFQDAFTRVQQKQNTTVPPHNINAPLTSKEEDDIESEYMAMKVRVDYQNGQVDYQGDKA
ncbi:Sds3-like-domain-containing protein [Chlamydoabsidia padenii]|nr:Sds3-like-domain-containing protein [Chlamydoabsidia padenii]